MMRLPTLLTLVFSFSGVIACGSDNEEGAGGSDGGTTLDGTGGTTSDGNEGANGTDGTTSDGNGGANGDGGTSAIEGPGPGSSETYEELDGLVAVEAEHFASYDNKDAPRDFMYTSVDFTPGVTPDPDENHAGDASGQAYLETLPDTRVTHDDPIKEGESIFNNAGTGPTLDYNVHFNTAGTYYVWVRAYSTGGEDNGIHVGINGTFPESGQKLQFCSGKNQWSWSSNKRDSGGTACGIPNTITIEVPSAGTHTVQFSMREDGFEFDKWLMTTDEQYVPDGAGPDESTL